MSNWKVTIEAIQPLSIASVPNRQTHWETTTCLRGSTLRGAIAELWKYKAGFDHPLTETMFKEGIFRDAYPEETYFSPIYIRKGKQSKQDQSLFKMDKNDQPYQVDFQPNGELLVEKESYSSNVVINQAVGIEISNAREAAKIGQLYSLSAIAEGTVFETTASLPKEGLEQVCIKTKSGYEGYVYIGKKRSSGYGKVKIMFSEVVETDSYKELSKRIEHFSLNQGGSKTIYISLVNKSPMVLKDRFLRFTSEIDWYEHLLPLCPERAVIEEVIRSNRMNVLLNWGKTEQRHGWNDAWNLPKQVEWVIQEGGIQLAKFTDLTEVEKDSLIKLLVALEQNGIGERTSEGFGQMSVCYPLEVNKLEDTAPASSVVPINPLLEQAKEFAKTTYKVMKISQWHNLLQIDERQIVKEIIELDNGDNYIAKRKKSRLKNSWNKEVDYQRKTATIADHLINVVKEIFELEKNYRKAGQSTKEFLTYVVGYTKIYSERKN